MKLVNDQVVPENLPIKEFGKMMETSDMQIFALACEALRNNKTHEAYELLKRYIDSKDKFKRRYIMSVIFDFDESMELSKHFLNALQSDDRMFVTTVLEHLIHRNLWVSDEQILSCFEKNHNWLDSYYYQILRGIEKNPQHTERLICLLSTAETNSAKIAVAQCMKAFAAQDNYMRLFELLANSDIAKLRMEACGIAHKFGRNDLLYIFKDDPDGHIRKFINQVL